MARLAFFGTPEFSLPALRALMRVCEQGGHSLELVITQPDKEQGRGQKLQAPPVKLLAQDLGIKVLQPWSLRKDTLEGDAFFHEFKAARIDMAVVVAYGKIIPRRFLALNCDFINIHGSLLPRFRGAAPVQRAIEYGDTKTGVCLMEVVQKLDEGDVFAMKETPILASDNSSSLFRRLSHLGADLLYEKMEDLLHNRLRRKPQGEHGVVYASMIEKSEGAWSFNESAALLSRKARAFDPWPTLYAYLNNKRVQFFDSFFIDTNAKAHLELGTVVALKPFLGITALKGIVYFQKIQIEGKRAMPVKEALLGFNVKVGDVLLRQN